MNLNFVLIDVLQAFNRTTLELKYDGRLSGSSSSAPFNRTTLELKFCQSNISRVFVQTFNRTTLELK